ncbi:MAG: translational GTPase TypA [Myxococcales bacterium]|nr:translational GTPase TypA [Myxococcales bacterium]
MPSERARALRNIAIIAHVDHGKTTLVDAMLAQTGVFAAHEQVIERALDSNDLERERGITILAKNTSVLYGDTRINIIDTPGHADFGGEVERTLLMADGALLLVDAAEGPLPQTRFVLQHALGLGLPIIVVINKIDRKDARASEVLDETFDLFCELGASDEQADFPTLYTIATRGTAVRELGQDGENLTPLFETILERVPPPPGDPDRPLQMLVTNIDWDDYVGRLAVGRIMHGQLASGQQVARLTREGQENERVGQLFAFADLGRKRIESAAAGDIVALSGVEEVQIGDTLADPAHPEALPRIEVEAPTIKVRFHVNTSPFAGRSGKFVTSRHLRDRLQREAKKNLAMRVEDTDEPDCFLVFGRGELMIAVLVETMRREGYELALGNPEVVVRSENGQKLEPTERVVVDLPEEFVGIVTSALGERRARMDKMHRGESGRTRVEFVLPARALIGYRSQFMTDTRGTGLLTTIFEGWQPYAGEIARRRTGAMVADRSGTTTPYALFHLEPRGRLCVAPQAPVYEGMVVGEHSRASTIDVNVCREKKLTNIRAAGRDENVVLTPHVAHTIESAMEFIDTDELVEITPDAIRLRKKVLDSNRRPKSRA